MLALGLLWTVLIRVPLVLNAEDHLDSDLAVDGLTLLDAMNGRWRWHYPGTPHIGILPVLFSYPQAILWGANPVTLVSGGTVIWALVVVSTFWLARRVFGPKVAGWAIVPLVFSSLGTIWLSGRITGGHLLILVWHTVAFLGLYLCLHQGSRLSAAGLGLWSGLGLYLDALFALTLAGLVPAAAVAWFRGGRSTAGMGLAALFVAGMLVGLVPRQLGRWADPYDAYPAQFAPTLERAEIVEHLGLLTFGCLPRLIAGTDLNAQGLRPFENNAGFRWPWRLSSRQSKSSRIAPAETLVVVVVLAVFLLGAIRLARDPSGSAALAQKAVARGLVISALAVVGAFLVNRNIFNSDNYRYLVYLLTPWSFGFGLLAQDLARRGTSGQFVTWIIVGVLGAGMTAATFHWYRDTRHYIDSRGLPLRIECQPWSELLVRGRQPPAGGKDEGFAKFDVPSAVTHVFGGYWDVYRMAFLSRGHVSGIPFPIYPNRFPGWSRGLGPGRGKLLVLHPREDMTRGGKSPADSPAGHRAIFAPMTAIDWRPAFMTVWKADGRPREEVELLRVVVP
jgi:hypothetical protein